MNPSLLYQTMGKIVGQTVFPSLSMAISLSERKTKCVCVYIHTYMCVCVCMICKQIVFFK